MRSTPENPGPSCGSRSALLPSALRRQQQPSTPLCVWRLSVSHVSTRHGSRRGQTDRRASVTQNPPENGGKRPLNFQGLEYRRSRVTKHFFCARAFTPHVPADAPATPRCMWSSSRCASRALPLARCATTRLQRCCWQGHAGSPPTDTWSAPACRHTLLVSPELLGCQARVFHQRLELQVRDGRMHPARPAAAIRPRHHMLAPDD